MAKRPRKKAVRFGGFLAIKTGTPSPFSDIYYGVMEMSWPAFIALSSGVFAALNLLFGLLYALLPGAISNAAPGSIVDGFFFSVDTLATVGYGGMAPVTRLGHAVASVEILIGLFFSATMTGLIFARFARPRECLMFSRVAVLGRFEGRRALMIRVTTTRARPLVDAVAQLSWLETVEMPGRRPFRRLNPLPLMRDRNPTLSLSWTLVHILEDDSPLLAALAGEERFMLTLTVSGLDTLLATQTTGGARYLRDDVLIDHEFVDVMSEDGGVIHLDLHRFHDTAPILS